VVAGAAAAMMEAAGQGGSLTGMMALAGGGSLYITSTASQAKGPAQASLIYVTWQ